jgi:sugar (pentulose or hexulose) kinase
VADLLAPVYASCKAGDRDRANEGASNEYQDGEWRCAARSSRRRGGARNRLLCQMTADATDRVVLSGPAEATVLGNILVQAMAAGRIASLGEGRDLIARSFPVDEYVPMAHDHWQDAYARFRALIGDTPASELHGGDLARTPIGPTA